jgi:hypothetical protein
MNKIVRTTISIPATLKARMDELCEGVNWSAVAAQAFEAKVAEAIAQKGARDMEDVISRLRASKAKSDEQVSQESQKAGRQWAMRWAEATWLERLVEAREATADWDWGAMFNSELNWPHECAYLMMTGTERGEADHSDVRAFWETAIGDDYGKYKDDPAYIEGFLEGAMDLWHEVKDRI